MKRPGDSSTLKRVVGERIREKRKRLGLTQEGVAELAELDRKHISMVETGQAEPRIGTLVSIAGALKVPVEELTTGLVFVTSEHSTGYLEVRAT
jgi:transcriptional regulator with XRE-family HTH domain